MANGEGCEEKELFEMIPTIKASGIMDWMRTSTSLLLEVVVEHMLQPPIKHFLQLPANRSSFPLEPASWSLFRATYTAYLKSLKNPANLNNFRIPQPIRA